MPDTRKDECDECDGTLICKCVRGWIAAQKSAPTPPDDSVVVPRALMEKAMGELVGVVNAADLHGMRSVRAMFALLTGSAGKGGE